MFDSQLLVVGFAQAGASSGHKPFEDALGGLKVRALIESLRNACIKFDVCVCALCV